jgi:hypothetical protein
MLILERHDFMTVDRDAAGDSKHRSNARSRSEAPCASNAEPLVSGALPRTPGFSSGMGSHRSGGLQDLLVQSGGSCGLWYCQTAGQNLQAIFNRHQSLKKTGQRVRWQGRRITLASNVTPTLRREYPWLVASPQSQRPFSPAQPECHSGSISVTTA